MVLNSHAFDPEHPLLVDRERLERILDVMYAKIQKTLFPWRRPGRRQKPETSLFGDAVGVELILDGTGVSADEFSVRQLSRCLSTHRIVLRANGRA